MSITESDIVKILDIIYTDLHTIAKLRGQLAAIINERDVLKRQIVALNQQIEALKDAAR